ncbi:MAG TPA: ribosome biogenesis GTPase Der [Firmicutes bacterium]|nr:ribosome biogenesis GTPase Der [Bacillota bacterium]
MKSEVVIVGRPNVGKSTLFNRIACRKTAITHGQPGVTRDIVKAEVEWRGRTFSLVDTGGLYSDAPGELEAKAIEHAKRAMSHAGIILFVVDARAGVTPEDKEIADELRRSGKPVLLVANKADHVGIEDSVIEFWELGMGEPIPVSAEHGLGVGDLLDRVYELLPEGEAGEAEVEATRPRVAIVGRPNAGKSSILNRIVGEERCIVSEIPGTTRDSIDVVWQGSAGRFLFIDTPGLRRKTKIEAPLEKLSAGQALRSIHRSDVCILVIDASTGVTDQDRHIAGQIVEHWKAAVVAANKWDLVTPEDRDATLSRIRWRLDFLDYARVLPVSALTGQGIKRLIDEVKTAWESHSSRQPTSDVNFVLRDATLVTPIPSGRSRKGNKLFYATQVSTSPPTFVAFVSDPEAIPESYRRYMQQRLRDAFQLNGCPIRLVLRARR